MLESLEMFGVAYLFSTASVSLLVDCPSIIVANRRIIAARHRVAQIIRQVHHDMILVDSKSTRRSRTAPKRD
jgi:hypothetical protein